MPVNQKGGKGQLVEKTPKGGDLDIDSVSGRARWGSIISKMQEMVKDHREIKKKAYAIGCELLSLKADCIRGQFTQRLMETPEMARRTAFRYMALSERLNEMPEQQRNAALNSDEGMVSLIGSMKRQLQGPTNSEPGEADESDFAFQLARWKSIKAVHSTATGILTKLDTLKQDYGDCQEYQSSRKAIKTVINRLDKWQGPKPEEPEA